MPQDFTLSTISDSIITGTNSSVSWNQLTHIVRKIVIAVVYKSSPEETRKQMKMSHSTIYRHRSGFSLTEVTKPLCSCPGGIIVSDELLGDNTLLS